MPGYARRFARLHPVESLKHVVETNGSVSGSSASVTDVITTVDSPLSANPNQVKKMSTVSSIYLRVEVSGRVAAGGINNIYMMVYKNPAALLTPPSVDNVGTSDRRKYVIHQEMLMLAPVSTSMAAAFAFPRTMFNGVIKIPRGYKRNGVKDKLQVILQHRTGEATQTTDFCIECIYKEFS